MAKKVKRSELAAWVSYETCVIERMYNKELIRENSSDWARAYDRGKLAVFDDLINILKLDVLDYENADDETKLRIFKARDRLLEKSV